MLVDKFKDITTILGWYFNYGDYQWANLMDMFDDTITAENDGELAEFLPAGIPNKAYFLLLWKDREKAFSDFNRVISETFTGEFLLVERSRLDDRDHNYKYEVHIKKMEKNLDRFQEYISDCDNLHILSWIETEVENELDTNVDGIKVKFKIRHDK